MKMLIIGGGAVSELWHVRSAVKLLGRDNVWVAETDPERRDYLRHTFNLSRIESSYREMLESVDLAVVATPPHLHAQIVVECLEKRVAVLCEKPLANNSSECGSILEAESRTKTPLGVCHNYRYFPNRPFSREKIKSGYFGDQVTVDISEGGVSMWPSQTGYTFRKDLVPGGVLLNNGLHALDFMLWCFGKPVDVNYRDDAIGGLESNASLQLRFESHRIGRLQLSRTCKMTNTIQIEGDRSSAYLKAFNMNHVFDQNGAIQVVEEIDGVAVRNFEDAADLQMQHFIDGVRQGKLPNCSGKEGADVIELIETCYAQKNSRSRPEKIPLPGIMW